MRRKLSPSVQFVSRLLTNSELGTTMSMLSLVLMIVLRTLMALTVPVIPVSSSM